MSDIELKISLPEYDVKTATPEQCSVHSSYPPLKAAIDKNHFATLKFTFAGGITQNLTKTIFTMAHGYNYIPATLSSIIVDGDTLAPTTLYGTGLVGVGATLEVKAYADATNYYVTVYDDFFWIDATTVIQISYYIFAEDGA